jgi:phenylpropionate dioxygenase-like ring-hydroxylating dioxygenase large terminal subunit
MTIAPSEFPRGPDLRRTGAHPDFWYPLAWSEDLAAGKTLARRFAGAPIVLFRGKAGQVFALEDRCAHRQVPLSLGVVEGETLRCGYHGWAYNQGGKCIDVPYLGRERPRRSAPRPTPATRRAGSTATSPATTLSCTRTCST